MVKSQEAHTIIVSAIIAVYGCHRRGLGATRRLGVDLTCVDFFILILQMISGLWVERLFKVVQNEKTNPPFVNLRVDKSIFNHSFPSDSVGQRRRMTLGMF